MKCYIFDIDGTLADASHRLHFIKQDPKDWDAFFAACTNDKPIKHMVDLAHTLTWSLQDGDWDEKVIFATGRPERIRHLTLDWLAYACLSGDIIPQLYMRSDTDRRPDDILKLDLLKKIRADGYEPIMAFEDRSRVVKMWRDNGVPCCQVSEGDY